MAAVTVPADLADRARGPLAGLGTLYVRRLRVTTKTASGLIGQFLTPVLWVLVVAPALDTALGGFNPTIDYYTYVAVSQATFIVPFTAMFNGLNVIVDKDFGVTREMLVAPVRRSLIPVANSLAVLTIALAQVAVILGLAVLRGAEIHTSADGLLWLFVAAGLLALGMYGIAETLALRIGRQEAYGPLIPAIGVTPYMLCGALFPISILPAGIEQATKLSPWTHALALMRHGAMEGTDSGLDDIWHLGSNTPMAWASLGVLALFATITLTVAVHVFRRTTTS
jgi:ABC-2 type transport system permease protein